jgi:saccharopine dehydrogenase (NAD+, L-lysine-forming)
MTWMIYGANGYTGELIAREAISRGHKPVLAGRNAPALHRLAAELAIDPCVFNLQDPNAITRALEGIDTVVHAAGPFVHTSRPMVDACLRTRTHYLDITGEIAVFEAIMARNGEARNTGVALIPGVGFDVVPSDCLAAMLATRMPDATDLELAFIARGGAVSRGTLRTMIEGAHLGGAIRVDGKITKVPTAWDAKDIPFSCGVRHAMTIPWGDVSTAWHSTGIPNIRVYSGASPRAVRRMRMMRPILPLLKLTPLRRLLQALAGSKQGPDLAMRETGRMYLWGQVSKPGADPITMTMETPEGYALTALTAVRSVERVLSGIEPGAWTPSKAFGAEFIREIEGVVVG